MRLAGKNPVFEKLRINPRSIRKIYLQTGFAESSFVRQKANKNGIPVLVISPVQMSKIGRGKNTQGIIADVADFDYILFDDLLETAIKKKRTIIFIDGLTDPQNLGAILRSLGCLGRFSVVLPTHESVKVTEAVLRVASGGENYVPIAQVANLNKAINQAKENHFTIIGTVTSEGRSIYELELPSRIGLVVGGEQKGIRPVVEKNLDIKVTVPMHADTMSLNAAQATTIFCYEIIRQQIKRKEENL